MIRRGGSNKKGPGLDRSTLRADDEARQREFEERERTLAEREAELARRLKDLGVEEATVTRETEVAEQGVPEPVEEMAGEVPAPVPERVVERRHPDALLEVAELDVHYGPIQALRGLNVHVRPGEVVALLGANGAGKSSTLRAISGMVAPTGGAIWFEGERIDGLAAQQVVRRGVAHVPEGRELFPTLTVEENLRLGYWPQRQARDGLKGAFERIYTMFPRLAERRTQAAGTMSGGEQQMLAFGRALISSPKLLLVDEMSLGLAPLIVRTLFDAVDQIHHEGKSVVIVEQFVHQALRHAQRAYVLAKGEIALEARASKLRNDPKLLAAYLGGAEGHAEEISDEAVVAEPVKKSTNGSGKTHHVTKTTARKGSATRRNKK